MRILAIDPGNIESAYVLLDAPTGLNQILLDKGKIDNRFLRDGKLKELLFLQPDEIAIEMIASYGMSVGQPLFDSCVWIGIFKNYIENHSNIRVKLIFRKTIKMHHSHSVRAKDGDINTVLQAKYGFDNTIKKPNKFYWNEWVEKNKGAKSMNGDIWAALALATYILEPKDYPLSNLQEREEMKLTPNLIW